MATEAPPADTVTVTIETTYTLMTRVHCGQKEYSFRSNRGEFLSPIFFTKTAAEEYAKRNALVPQQ